MANANTISLKGGSRYEFRTLVGSQGYQQGLRRHPGPVRGELSSLPGDILGIIGPNGSGKTTLVNCITGFVRADSGKVLFKGKDITNRPPHKIADLGVTRTFQVMRPYYSLPAYKNLIIPLFSPRARRTGGWRGGGKLGTATPWRSTSWKRSALSGIPMSRIRWRPRCPPGT